MITERGTILSLPDAIGRILEEYIGGGVVAEADVDVMLEEKIVIGAQEEVNSSSGKDVKDIADYGFMPGCPDCGVSLVMAEGCVSFKSCGYNKCM